MKPSLQYITTRLLEIIIEFDECTVDLNQLIIKTMFIHQALINISYLSDIEYHFRIVKLIARPWTHLELDWLPYITVLACIQYILNLLVPQMPGKQISAVYSTFLDVGVFTLLFETGNGIISYIAQALLLFIGLIRQWAIQGRLDIEPKNFNTIRNTKWITIQKSATIVQMYLYLLDINQVAQIVITMLIALLAIITWTSNPPRHDSNLIVIVIGIHILAIFYSIILLFDLTQVSLDLIIIPFVFKAVSMVVTIYSYREVTTLSSMISRLLDNNRNDLLLQYDQVQQIQQLEALMKKSKKPIIEDQIVFASILLYTNQSYQAFATLSSIIIHDQPVLQAKANKLIVKCTQRLQIKIKASSNEQEGMAEHIRQLMNSEAQHYNIYSQLTSIIKSKVECQQELSRLKFWNGYSLIKRMCSLRQLLESQYETYPSEKTQAILGFYLVEVLNDYLGANTLFSVAALADDKIMKMGLNNQIFNNKMAYLVFDYQESLIIRRMSNNAPQFFQLEATDLIDKAVDFLIPNGVQEHHQALIQDLFVTGQSKYMRKIDDNYYINKERMISTEFSVDITFNKEKINFLAFFQPTINQPMTMIVNQFMKITQLSESLLIQLGQKTQSLIGIPIEQVIPQFVKVQGRSMTLDNVDAKFKATSTMVISQDQIRHDQYYLYACTVQVRSRNIGDKHGLYYILVFEYLRKLNQLNKSNSMTQTIKQTIDSVSMSEEVSIIKPYEDLYAINIRADSMQPVEVIPSQLCPMSPSNSYLADRTISPAQPLYFTRDDKHKDSIEEHPEARQQLEVVIEDQMDDCGSQVSSLQGVRRSKYYKKYEITQKINELPSYSRNHKLFIGTLLMCLLVQFTLIFIVIIYHIQQLINLDTSLTNLVSDIDLLQIKNLMFQPLESFLITRWTLVNYNVLLGAGTITPAQHVELNKFPKSNLNLGYDLLASNLALVLNRKELQQFLENTMITVQTYIATNKGDAYNVSLRNSLSILMNYQYIIKKNYEIEGTVSADTPQIYYAYRNYQPLKDNFHQLNLDIFEGTMTRAETMQQSIFVLFLLIIICLGVFASQSIYHYYSIQDNYINYYVMILKCEQVHIDQDLARYKLMLEQLQKDQNVMCKYTFSLENLELQIEQQIQRVNEIKAKTRRESIEIKNISKPKSVILILLLFCIILGSVIATYSQGSFYLGLYPKTAKLYKDMSDVGTDVPTLYAQREILYFRTAFPYLSTTDFDNLLLEVTTALERIDAFITSIEEINSVLLSEQFTLFYQSVEEGDLCEFLDPELKIKAINICSVVSSGNMKRGLKSILIYMYNQIQTDYAINKFTSRNFQNYLELEGAFLVSDIIRTLNKEFNKDLSQQTTNLLYTIDTYNIILLVGLGVVMILLLTSIRIHLTSEYYIVQRFCYLAPRYSILMDDYFERNIRALIIQDLVN